MKNGKIFLMLLLICTLLTFTACATNDNLTPSVPDVSDDEGVRDGYGGGGNNGGGNTNNGGPTNGGNNIDGGVEGGMNDPRTATNGGITD